ncbi:translation initiation factor IF-2 [Patescibacteria group bacterium]|nr:translation initiation factor IF-2 [Patescibacteria group bacterium]
MKDRKNTENRRPPIITIMGHVDHGKTTLLDAIKGSTITATESGGITQHIKAFSTQHNNRKITFIDTPGHEFFSDMRKRGVLKSDIVLLVVAADDGVNTQTKEVINIIKEMNLKTIVVINKIDLPNANIQRVKNELTKEGILLEGFGGDITYSEISAKNKVGINELLDLILLEYDLKDITNSEYNNSLIILESFKNESLGNTSLCIIEDGTLKVGYFLHTKDYEDLGKIRVIKNDDMENIKEASVSTPVYISGQNELLDIGDRIFFSKDKISKKAKIKDLEKNMVNEQSIEEMLQNSDNDKKTLSIIIKSDTKGSIEAIKNALLKINLDNVTIDIYKTGIGTITEEDLNTAKTTHSILLGFKVKVPAKITKEAQLHKVILINYDIIYELINDVVDAAESLIPPEFSETFIGSATIKAIFTLSNKSLVLGILVEEGQILKNNKCKIERNGEILYTGKISSIKRLKEEVNSVNSGTECGIIVTPNTEGIQTGDKVTCFKLEKI